MVDSGINFVVHVPNADRTVVPASQACGLLRAYGEIADHAVSGEDWQRRVEHASHADVPPPASMLRCDPRVTGAARLSGDCRYTAFRHRSCPRAEPSTSPSGCCPAHQGAFPLITLIPAGVLNRTLLRNDLTPRFNLLRHLRTEVRLP